MNEAIAPAIIKTAIVEDMRDVREGLATLINFTDGFSLTGSYRSMEEAIPKIKGNVPDVLLSDIGLMLLGEAVTPTMLAAGLLILGSVAFSQRAK